MSKPPLRAVFIHGIGTHNPGFSGEARRRLARSWWVRTGRRSVFAECDWGDLADRNQSEMVWHHKLRGHRSGPAAEMAQMVLADATYYLTSERLRTGVSARLGAALERAGRGPKVVFAHSLGCLATIEHLLQNPDPDVRLVTMGCNLDLFRLDLDTPVEVPDTLKRPGRWVNFWHRRDGLGFPISWRFGLEHVRDIRVPLGGVFRGWTALSHILYWDDADLWQDTVPLALQGMGV